MLTLYDANRLGRRAFLRVGGLGWAGLSLPSWLAAHAQAAGSEVARDTRVILLFLHGGPSQFETFDPKMTAPSNIRSATGEVATSLPGITFGGSFPRLARLAHRLAIVRAFTTGDGNHDIKPVVSRHSFGANLGSLFVRARGTTTSETGLPANVLLFPRAVNEAAQAEQLAFGDFRSTGRLGAGVAPLVTGAGGGFQDDLKLNVPLARLDDRRLLLERLDQLRRRHERGTTQGDPLRERALETILGSAADAFRWQAEDPRTIARYDTQPLVRPDQINPRWKNYQNYVDNAQTLGKLLLLARRLCERGCGFVTVTTNFVWDMHADVNNAPMAEGMRYMGLPLDYALSAFIEDCDARGLDRNILLVCCGEMGRTPRLNDQGGRDHWGDLAPLLIYGGGLQMGQVIGQSDRQGARPASDPVTIPHLLGTLFRAQFHVDRLRLVPGLPREISTLANYQPIPGLGIN